ncbi:hypothetical protein [Halosegnis marinus]|uniref:hypothetical protein n=1 Tax=Halosegnis marinus TaxID=3034023 RepID=UPI00361CBE55
MTDSIDLDDIDVQDDDEEPEANPGDWLWKGDGDPDEEPEDGEAGLTGADIGDATPRVPRDTDGKPVGIPKEGAARARGRSRPPPAVPATRRRACRRAATREPSRARSARAPTPRAGRTAATPTR